MPALAEAKQALLECDPAVARSVEASVAEGLTRMDRSIRALTRRGTFATAHNVVRARAAFRVDLHKALSRASLMLATRPATILARKVPLNAMLYKLEALADTLLPSASGGGDCSGGAAMLGPEVVQTMPSSKLLKKATRSTSRRRAAEKRLPTSHSLLGCPAMVAATAVRIGACKVATEQCACGDGAPPLPPDAAVLDTQGLELQRRQQVHLLKYRQAVLHELQVDKRQVDELLDHLDVPDAGALTSEQLEVVVQSMQEQERDAIVAGWAAGVAPGGLSRHATGCLSASHLKSIEAWFRLCLSSSGRHHMPCMHFCALLCSSHTLMSTARCSPIRDSRTPRARSRDGHSKWRLFSGTHV
jgi:hypothetical protein